MTEKKQDDKFYLHKYLAECVLAVFSNRPEVLKILEIAGKYLSIIEDLRSRLPAVESNVNLLIAKEQSDETFLVFVDGKLYPTECQVESDIYTDQYEVSFPSSIAEDCSTKLIQVVRLKFSDRKVGYPKREEARDDSTAK